ncbi:hypothetical protein Pcinc_019957 [Petrolisthes cinctipes]|uniref:Uncharacterized protein n=1 Tax=Petrolisthes cinctipes TaxID=88211 RepID=A0AAE1KLZ1_PETCI|nr:hypothetical protein Pcinc_019957 [Petrolisthes cinctipes]
MNQLSPPAATDESTLTNQTILARHLTTLTTPDHSHHACTTPAPLSPRLHHSHHACTTHTTPAPLTPRLHHSHHACTTLTTPAPLSPRLHHSHHACTTLTTPAPRLHQPYP